MGKTRRSVTAPPSPSTSSPLPRSRPPSVVDVASVATALPVATKCVSRRDHLCCSDTNTRSAWVKTDTNDNEINNNNGQDQELLALSWLMVVYGILQKGLDVMGIFGFLMAWTTQRQFSAFTAATASSALSYPDGYKLNFFLVRAS